jgi:hypothetical protein
MITIKTTTISKYIEEYVENNILEEEITKTKLGK